MHVDFAWYAEPYYKTIPTTYSIVDLIGSIFDVGNDALITVLVIHYEVNQCMAITLIDCIKLLFQYFVLMMQLCVWQ